MKKGSNVLNLTLGSIKNSKWIGKRQEKCIYKMLENKEFTDECQKLYEK